MPSRSLLFILLIMLIMGHAQAVDVLPAPLYFIRYNDQIWRMGTDATTLMQITHENAPVTGFDMSPVDGALVYVSHNDLIRADAVGEGQDMLVDGIAITKEADSGEGYLQELNGEIRSPRWSPDGEQIAFAMGGIQMIPAQGGEPALLLPNSLSEAEDDPMIAFLNSTSYLPEAWSPDGTRLVVQVLMPPEQGGLAILNLEDNALIPITNEDYGNLTCCYPSWSRDSATIYLSIANHFFTPGLWRADAQTGESEALIDGLDDNGTFSLVAYPRGLRDGKLYTFLTITDQPDPNNIMPLTMYRSALDGITDREALRSDSYQIGQALWAEDGSGAVIEAIMPSDETQSLLWLSSDGTPAVSLNISGSNLRWGHSSL